MVQNAALNRAKPWARRCKTCIQGVDWSAEGVSGIEAQPLGSTLFCTRPLHATTVLLTSCQQPPPYISTLRTVPCPDLPIYPRAAGRVRCAVCLVLYTCYLTGVMTISAYAKSEAARFAGKRSTPVCITTVCMSLGCLQTTKRQKGTKSNTRCTPAHPQHWPW